MFNNVFNVKKGSFWSFRLGIGPTETEVSMLRRLIFYLLLFSLAVPSLASAWTITAKIGTPAGSISGGSPLVTVSTGTGYITVPAGDTTVTVTPSAGYRVSLVTLDGVSITAPSAGGDIVIPQAGKSSRALTAYFTATTYSVTVTQAPNGIVTVQQTAPTIGSISQTGLTSLRTGAVVKVTASPSAGYHVTSIKVAGVSVWTGDSAAPQIYNYTVGTTSPTVTATFALVPVARASLLVQTTSTTVNTPITLDASGSTTNDPALTYRFAITSGNSATAILTPDTPTLSPTAVFQATAVGVYAVNVTVTSANGGTNTSAETAITVVSQADYESGVCTSCHANRDPAITNAYKLSVHSTSAGISCPSCHNPDNLLPHPYLSNPVDSCRQCHSTVTPQLVTEYLESPHNGAINCTGCHSDHSVIAQLTVCQNCHAAAFSGNGIHAIFATLQPDVCAKCHTTHNPRSGATSGHFNGYTSYANPGYHASYVTPRTLCSNCHLTQADNFTFKTEDPDMKEQRLAWSASGHGDVFGDAVSNQPKNDWKRLGQAGIDYADGANVQDCVRCHTPSGYLQYLNSGFSNVAPVGSAGDQTSEPLSCNICHTEAFVYGEMQNYMYTNVLDTGAAVSYYNFSSQATKKIYNWVIYNDLGESNVCMPCHTGRQAGSTITKAANAGLDFTNTPFLDAHSMAAGAVLFKKAGYSAFKTGLNYTDPGVHTFGGADQGPCVVCHLDSSAFVFGFSKNHSFTPLVKNEAGAVTAIANPACYDCHEGEGNLLSPDILNTLQAQYQASLRALAAQLALKQMHYNANIGPYFFNSADDTTPANAVTNWLNKHVMGAAFNLHLLTKENSAYIHNPRITRLLVYDSIDQLDNGVIDASVKATLNALPADTEYKAATLLYLLPNGVRP